MTKFILIRHGETNYNLLQIIQGWQQSELSPKGLIQAREASQSLPHTPNVIISSDLLRCRQTTDAISRDLPGTPVFYDWHFRERSFGNLEGKPASLVDWDIFFYNSETLLEHNVEPESHMTERLKLGIRDTEMLGVETVLLVTHGGVFNRFGALLNDDYQQRRYKNTETLIFDVDYNDPRLASLQYPTWSLTNE